jgi:hypothetical protein
MAAEALGISRKNLWEKLKAHGIGATEDDADPQNSNRRAMSSTSGGMGVNRRAPFAPIV